MFNAIARPFGMLLMLFYELVQNYGLAMLLVAVSVRVLLLPFQMKGKRGQLRQTRLQPKLAELQKKHGANKQKLNEEMAKLYREEGVNPASGCLWSFIQMPIMIAIFYAIRSPLTLMMGVKAELLERGEIILTTLESVGAMLPDEILDGFYAQVHIAQAISYHWDAFKDLGIEGLRQISFYMGELNLSQQPNFRVWDFPWDDATLLLPMIALFFFPVISCALQFVSTGIMRKMNTMATPEGAMGSIIKFMPLMSLWFGFILPAALSFYWAIGTVLQIAQDVWLTKKYTKILDAEDAEKAIIRKAKEEELEAKRLETERKKAEGIIEQNANTSKRKKKIGSKQEKLEKAAEWEKKNAPPSDEDDEGNEPSRVGNRRFARGRAYVSDRYENEAVESDSDEDTDEDIEEIEYDVIEEEDIHDDGNDDYDDDDDGDDDSDEDDDSEEDEEGSQDDEDDSQADSTEKFETKRFD